jgi:undecaprenyl diphosphate synthase
MEKLQHLAVILDGNRRYAKSQNKLPWQGHDYGAENVEKLLEWSKKQDIREITLYALSIENLSRDKKEVDHLFDLFKKWFKKFKNNKQIHEDKVKISFIGNLSLVPEEIKELAQEVEEDTKDYNNYKLNICFAYGGRQELISAFNKLKDKEGEINEKDITNALWLQSEPQLIIRTGNKIRTSNFLPWQTTYSEWYFLEKMWPEFTEKDLLNAIDFFNNTQRNFGK